MCDTTACLIFCLYLLPIFLKESKLHEGGHPIGLIHCNILQSNCASLEFTQAPHTWEGGILIEGLPPSDRL